MRGLLERVRAFSDELKHSAWRRRAGPARVLPVQGASPGMFINTIPKSGSVFLENVLRDISGHRHLTAGTCYFPNDTLLLKPIRQFSSGGYIAQQHADCAPNNIALLEKYVGKWVVHLRDPRSVTLSWTHHLDRLIATGHADMLDWVGPSPDGDYLARDFVGRLDWQIERFLPSVVSWTAAWLNYADRNPQRVLVTTYEEMVSDEAAFVRRLLAFYGIPAPTESDYARYRTVEAHFRKGETDEWRRVFNDAQQQRALAAMPSELCRRLAWPFDRTQIVVRMKERRGLRR